MSETANAKWRARSIAAIWHPCTQMKALETLPPVPIARAQGAWLYDFEGNRYLDAISSWWVNLFGHANPRINAALAEQLRSLEHVMLAGLTHRPAIELAERLSALAPPGLGHAFFGSDGASATEIALKMSFHCWSNRGKPEKRGFVSLAGSYHGETLGALSVTDVPLFRNTYAPLLARNTVVACPDTRLAKEGQSPSDVAAQAAGALEAHLAQHHATTAALVVEPLVQGASGMVMYDPAYLALARELCTRHQVHLIADEIMTGFGRTGTLFACEQAGIAPDLLCLSKGLTGGYLPLSCVLSTDDIYGAFYADETARGFLHSHSYTGNALACRAALAVLDIFRDDDVIATNALKAERFTALAAPLAGRPDVRHFRHRGMIWAFDTVTEPKDFARRFAAAALDRELLLRPVDRTVYFMPPYITTDAEFALLCERTADILDAL